MVCLFLRNDRPYHIFGSFGRCGFGPLGLTKMSAKSKGKWLEVEGWDLRELE